MGGRVAAMGLRFTFAASMLRNAGEAALLVTEYVVPAHARVAH
jgi:hypothetical protein